MSLIRDALDSKPPDSADADEGEDGLSTCPDCGAKVDTVALKKRMAADREEYKGKAKDWDFWENMAEGSRKSNDKGTLFPPDKGLQQKSDDARRAAFRTAGNWAARRDTLNAERAKPKGRK